MGIWASEETEHYQGTFTNADLVTGVLTLTHNLGVAGVPHVAVYDNTSQQITPDEITKIDSNSCSIGLTSFGTLAGTWGVSVVG